MESWLVYIAYLPIRCVYCLGIICQYIIRTFILRIPVSFPGYDKKKKVSRIGKWLPKDITLGSGWLFAEDVLSHVISEDEIPGSKLYGKSSGRQIWYKDVKNQETSNSSNIKFNVTKNPNAEDKILREILMKRWLGSTPDTTKQPQNAREAAVKALTFYQMLQCSDGHWAGDYGGPMFLMPGLICVLYITKLLGTIFPKYKIEAIVIYLKNHQQIDGGWGTHIECASTMFGTVLSYVTLRLLGESADESYMTNARNFIHSHGGAIYCPSWAKFWLATIGVYDWRGINSIPVEMWLLPRWFPFHPGKLWCHCRMVYLPMGYIYCKRFVPEMDETLLSLRKELYLEPYDSISWNDTRQLCASIDEYSPLNPIMKLAQDFLTVYESFVSNISWLQRLRTKGLEFAMDYINAEDSQTNFIDIGPVNKSLNMLCVWINGNYDLSNHRFQNHIPRIDDYLWVAEDGMKMQGYNGSQCWDTSFAVQAIIDGSLHHLFPDCLMKAYHFLNVSQIENNEEDMDYFYRHRSKGGWPFSTSAHGWPISDCTAEGLKAVLSIHDLSILKSPDIKIKDQRLLDSCDVILSLQNADGGWATYENNRGYGWYEMLNPSEVFGDIMIDYSYVECTSASIKALKMFSKTYGYYKSSTILNSIKSGVEFLKSIQREDGSWYGSWGVCFTYGTWFGIGKNMNFFLNNVD